MYNNFEVWSIRNSLIMLVGTLVQGFLACLWQEEAEERSHCEQTKFISHSVSQNKTTLSLYYVVGTLLHPRDTPPYELCPADGYIWRVSERQFKLFFLYFIVAPHASGSIILK